MKGHTEIINMLIDAGVEINAQDKVRDRDRNDFKICLSATPCYFLKMNCDTISVQNGWTALINAAYWCHPEAVKLLIRRSCNVHLENKVILSAVLSLKITLINPIKWTLTHLILSDPKNFGYPKQYTCQWYFTLHFVLLA